MRTSFFCFVFLAVSLFQQVVAQEEQQTTVSGRMLSREGEPLPGVSIMIKGTNIGTTTDLEGYYSIEAAVGSTLVVSYVGYATYEVKVRQGMDKLLPAISAEQEEKGVAVLSDSSAGYEVEGGTNNHFPHASPYAIPIQLGSINLIHKDGKPTYVLVPSYIQEKRRAKFKVEYTTSVHRRVANKLPELQSTYAQGRAVNGALVARGPADNELFSWGPAIRDLSVAASGELVPQKENLPPAQSFEPYAALRTGTATDNHLQVFSEVSVFKLRAGYGLKTAQGIIPGNNFNRHAFDFSGQANIYPIKPRLFISYSQAEEQLPQRGANLASVLGSIYTTPPSFDLLHGVTGRKPWQNPSSYQDSQGNELSYAPDQLNHPFWLINNFRDGKKDKKFFSGIELKTEAIYPLSMEYKLMLDHQNSDDQFGFPPSSVANRAGSFTHRNYQASALTSNFKTLIKPDFYSDWLNFDLEAVYLFSYKEESLNRQDRQSSVSFMHRLQPYRRQHELISKANIYIANLNARRFIQMALSNRWYFSNTLADGAPAFLPAANLKVDLQGIEAIYFSSFISHAKVFASFATSLQEAPLIYNQWHFNSLSHTPSNYRQYYENVELSQPENLLPEQQQKWEIGTSWGLYGGSLKLDMSYYRHKTDNFILPVQDMGAFQLRNVSTVVTPGLEMGMSGNGYFMNGSYSLGLTYSRSRPRVAALYGPQNRIPIAGFQTISTNLIEGEPVGMLVGSQYLRNAEGQLIIGPEGFPLVDPEPGMIGNPNPDWLAGMHGSVEYKDFGFYVVIDGRKGGDIWNGTQQFLNFYGSSQLTADQRGVKDYVFEGVTPTGEVNQQKVDFYNPEEPFPANRWLRYGVAGVGEEGVEEASFIRINEIQLNYDLSRLMKKLNWVHQVKFSLLARNLLLYTTYSGLDPAGNLFGYQQARGLDLFNQPNTRSYGAALSLTF